MCKVVELIQVFEDKAKEDARTASDEFSREFFLGKINAYMSVKQLVVDEFKTFYLKEAE